MGLFARATPPNLPLPPQEYDRVYLDHLTKVLTLFFTQMSAVQQMNAARLNLNLDTMPTQADLADLRVGDVYVDTSASYVLKVKT
jgi:hypothetical protein